jgi:CRP-like cAMP-binding protein
MKAPAAGSLKYSTADGFKDSVDYRMRVLARSWLFAAVPVPHDDLSEMASKSEFRHFRKGEILFREGEVSDHLYVVHIGEVKEFKTARSGRAFTVLLLSSGDSLNIFSLFDTQTHYLSAQATKETTVIVSPRSDFLSLLKSHPEFSEVILSLSKRLISSAYERLLDFAGEMTSQRVINVLCMLYYKFGGTIHVTREEVANLAGTTTETAIRELAKLKMDKVIDSRRGSLVILDENRLRDISGGSYSIFSDFEAHEKKIRSRQAAAMLRIN